MDAMHGRIHEGATTSLTTDAMAIQSDAAVRLEHTETALRIARYRFASLLPGVPHRMWREDHDRV